MYILHRSAPLIVVTFYAVLPTESRTGSEQLFAEAEVLENCFLDLVSRIDDPDLFGSLLVQYELASESAVAGPVYSPEYTSKEQRIGLLLQLVMSEVKGASSPEEARKIFNELVKAIGEPLGCLEVAQTLTAMCSKF